MTALPKKHLGYGQNDQAYIFGKKNITLYRMFYRGKIELIKKAIRVLSAEGLEA